MISTIVSRLVILVFGTLYPAYASYKAVRTKNVKEYVKWMMYWIVFALFTCAETFTDVFLSWFPFYYEVKIILVLWLLSPATKGSSILYRKFVHPMLSRREQEIDEYIAKAREQGYHTVLNLGSKGVNYATTVIMQTAIRGGGGLVNQLRKSYSLSDLSEEPSSEVRAVTDRDTGDVIDARHIRRRHSPRRSASGSSRVDMYFSEVDIRPSAPLGHVRSTEDVSSGYSSAEPLYVSGQTKVPEESGVLVRTASVGGTTRSRTRTTRTGVSTKKTTTTVAEDSEDSESESEGTTTIIFRPQLSLQKSQPSTVIEESDSSEHSGDFEDSIGFPTENKPKKTEKEISFTINLPKPKISTSEDVINIVSEPVNEIPLEINSITKIENLILPATVVDLTADVFSSKIEELKPNMTQLEENVKNIADKLLDLSSQFTVSEIEDNIEAICNVEIQLEKQPSAEIFEDTIDNQSEVEQKVNSIKIEEIQKSSNKANKEILEAEKDSIIEENKINDTHASSLSSIAERGGRYNKHIAPIPPSDIEEEKVDKNIPNISINESIPSKHQTEVSENKNIESEFPSTSTQDTKPDPLPIKATLVLKPGIIKAVGPSSETSDKTEVFVSHSPKVKRKSSSKSPISRLMMLPKKLFGHKDAASSKESLKVDDPKRRSWNDDTRSLTPSSIEDFKSKSDTEDIETDNKHEKNKMILRRLSHSPKQIRRKVKSHGYYDDSD